MLAQKLHRWKRRLTGTPGWDIAALAPGELGRTVVVLSPHLDDAIFSLGATISRLVHTGARVTVLTIFGGDPESSAPAGEWDRRTGFRTAAEAAAARRIEDRRACDIVRAIPAWHSFVDVQYDDGTDDCDLIGVLEDSLTDAETLLVPGFPLTHSDHARLAPLVLANRVFSGRIALYTELPYGLWEGPARVTEPLRGLVPETLHWRGTRVGLRDIAVKIRACRAYVSQLPCYPKHIAWRMCRHELVSSEVIALLDSV